MISYLLPLVALSGAMADVNLGLHDKIRTCTENSNIGVYEEFGATLDETLIKTFCYEKKRSSAAIEPMMVELPTGVVDFTFSEVRLTRDPSLGYGLVSIHTQHNEVYKTVDQVLIHPNMWTTFSSAVLNVEVDTADIFRIKYQTVDCYCRERVVSLTTGEATTTACDGTTIAETPVIRSCLPDAGLIRFYPTTNQRFVKVHSRRPVMSSEPQSLEFGKCNADIVDMALPIFCLAVKYNQVVLDYLRVHPVDDVTTANGAFFKGYDYTKAIDIRPVSISAVAAVEVSVKYLMTDCTCRERRYLVQDAVAHVLSDKACYTFPKTLQAWTPPTK